jgi:hypothetical protein
LSYILLLPLERSKSMRTPSRTAHFGDCVTYGDYVSRRCRRAKLAILADDVDQVTTALLVAGRAWEDTERPIQRSLADRDGIDDDLDEAANDARVSLAGRKTTAVKEVPYTQVFPLGSTYYTAAPLHEETKRYGELVSRLESHLPDTDEVRLKTVASVTPNIAAFEGAVKVLNDARTAQALARTTLEAGRDAWDRQIEKTYGALVAQFGKAKAERFFPRVRSKKGKPNEE